MIAWPRSITPFRVAAILLIVALLVLGLQGAFLYGSGGSAWGGVAVIVAVFFMVVLWLLDALMRPIISDWRITWVIQLGTIAAMYFILVW